VTASVLIYERNLADNEWQFPLVGSVNQIVEKPCACRVARLGLITLAARRLNTLKEYKDADLANPLKKPRAPSGSHEDG
jgi:hypothetical protein